MAEEPHRPTAVRPFWSGTVTFGLVSVPVDIYPAVRTTRAGLRMLSPEGHPLHRRYVCPEHGPIEGDEIVRGYEIAPGQFVTVSDEELDALEPKRTREIDLRRFVDRAAIDPVYCDRPYLLLPQGEVTKPYRLLARTMEEEGRAGIATFVMRGREYLVAIVADGGILRAETLRRHDEVRTVEQVGLPAPVEADADTVERMKAAIDGLVTQDVAMSELADLEAQALRALAERKSEEELVHTEEVERGAGVLDIMQVLRERLGMPEAAAPPA